MCGISANFPKIFLTSDKVRRSILNAMKGRATTMQTGEVTKILGITPDRIRYFRKHGVFKPEHPPNVNKPTYYTAQDVAELKKLVILSKLNLTCGDIKKLQNGSWTLGEALAARRKAVEARIQRMTHAMELADIIMNDNAQFDTFDTNYYWNIIGREAREVF